MKALKRSIKNLEERFDEIVKNYTNYSELVIEMFQLLQIVVEENRGQFDIDWDFAVAFISGSERILWFPASSDYPGGGLSYSFDGVYIKGFEFLHQTINYPDKSKRISSPPITREITSDKMRRNSNRLRNIKEVKFYYDREYDHWEMLLYYIKDDGEIKIYFSTIKNFCSTHFDAHLVNEILALTDNLQLGINEEQVKKIKVTMLLK